jgi:GNAT superfamily N-acetyltransferase
MSNKGERVTIAVRPAEPADAALICNFIRELAEYERLTGECRATPEAMATSLFGPTPRVFCEIAEWDGEPAGFALWFYSYSTFQAKHGIYLEDLYVREQCRGRGLGKALIAALAERAVKEGCGRFEWSVLDWNAPSIAFYKSLGANAMQDWTVFRLEGEARRVAGQ